MLSDSEHRRALQVLNLTTTRNRLGMLPLFHGQRVRLTPKLSVKRQLVQEAVGAVLGVDLDDWEFEASGPRMTGAGLATMSRKPMASLACATCL